VDQEEEARLLVATVCPKNYAGEYVARELGENQTLANLGVFSDALERAHGAFKDHGSCTCKEKPMNELVKLLKAEGCVGPGKTMTRGTVARRLGIKVREVTFMGREARRCSENGKIHEFVCFSKAGKKGGLFLAASVIDIVNCVMRIRREGLSQLVEVKWAWNAIGNRPEQAKLTKGIEKLMEHIPDEVETDDNKPDAPGANDGGTPPGPPPGTP
jgi:hypothetical protein